MKEAMLWNKARNRSVRASKLRQFTIGPEWRGVKAGAEPLYCITGWFNANEQFDFGMFDTQAEAEAFLEAMHNQIEGKEV